jgi:hypothetical protein
MPAHTLRRGLREESKMKNQAAKKFLNVIKVMLLVIGVMGLSYRLVFADDNTVTQSSGTAVSAPVDDGRAIGIDDENRIVKFLDADGNTVNKIIFTENDEAVKSNNDKYVLLLENSKRFSLYDNSGTKLFEKSFDEHRLGYASNGSMTVSDNGTVAIIEGNSFDFDESLNPSLRVFDASGKEILTKPYVQGQFSVIDRVNLSNNGRYLAVRADVYKIVNIHVKMATKTVFFDLINGTEWIGEQSYVIDKITDYGIVTASFPNPLIKNSDTREKKLKEGTLNITIDLKQYLGGNK